MRFSQGRTDPQNVYSDQTFLFQAPSTDDAEILVRLLNAGFEALDYQCCVCGHVAWAHKRSHAPTRFSTATNIRDLVRKT